MAKARKPEKIQKPKVKAKAVPKPDAALADVVARACRRDRDARIEVHERKPAQVMPLLLAQFTAESPKVRAEAIALACAPLAYVKLLPLDKLLPMLDDPAPEVRASAAVAFSYSFPYEPFFKPQLKKIKPKLEALLRDPDTKVRARAQQALEELQREPDED